MTYFSFCPVVTVNRNTHAPHSWQYNCFHADSTGKTTHEQVEHIKVRFLGVREQNKILFR